MDFIFAHLCFLSFSLSIFFVFPPFFSTYLASLLFFISSLLVVIYNFSPTGHICRFHCPWPCTAHKKISLRAREQLGVV